MNIKKRAFSLIFAVGMVLILSLLVFSLLSYIIPFARNVKGIENASQAWYYAYSGIEDIQYRIKKTIGVDFMTGSTTLTGFFYASNSSGVLFPMVGKGESTINKNWNIISSTQPLQLLIGNGRLDTSGTSTGISLEFGVPDITTGTDSLPTSPDESYIFWQLASPNAILYATGTALFSGSHINTTANRSLWSGAARRGITGTGTAMDFKDFYSSECVSEECVLKVSVIRPLISSLNSALEYPFLHYKVRIAQPIPRDVSLLFSTGTSYGFSKQLQFSYPQDTVNSAFDFTVFQ